MKSIIATILFSVFIVTQIFSQIGFSPRVDSLSKLSTTQTLGLVDRQLSGDTSTIIGSVVDTIKSRHNNSPYNLKAAQFILERFQSYGLTARYMDYRSTGRNVMATKIGTKYPNRQYIICAHYDDMPTGVLAPGADDNASGTCAVIEAARILAPFTFDYTVIFIAFDEEEQGLIGSHAYADTAFNRGDSIMGVLNFDMIAYDGNNDYWASIYVNALSQPFGLLTKGCFNLYNPTLVPSVLVQSMSGSDHWYFWQRGYKAFCGIENTNDFNPYYHTVNDNYSHVIMPFFINFTQGAIASLMTFAWDYFITITHTPITSAQGNTPVVATAVITSPHPVAKITNGPRLYYKVNTGSFVYVNSYYNNLDSFKFQIPDQPAGSTVYYYIAAQDEQSRFVGTSPLGGRGIAPPGTTAPPTLYSYSVIVGTASNTDPMEFSLKQNYPNPFNPSTIIDFSLKSPSNVKIIVTDILGREVTTIINDNLQAGEHKTEFNGNNLSSGIYYYSMYLDGVFFGTKKMILLK
jgi:hypothetical protein